MAPISKLLFEASTPAQQAHKLGLEYDGFGNWKDEHGKRVAKTIDDKLVKVKSSKKPSPDKSSKSKKKDNSTNTNNSDLKKNLGRANILNFDERLLQKDVLITIQNKKGQETLITPTEFNKYIKAGKKQGDKIIYKKTSTHTTVSEHGLALYNQLIKRLNSSGGKFYILCDGEQMSDIVSYLHSLDIVKGVILVPIDMHKPEKKANFVDNKLKKGFTQINFFDNDAKDISSINKLKSKHKEITATLNSRLLNSVVL